jgi:1-deoxy-D-xylulose-5-phosphate synthase
MRFVKPLDEDLLHKVFKRFRQVITLEDGTISGGFGSAVLEFMADNGYQCQVKRLGVPDRFIEHGTQAELYRECGFDPESIAGTIKSLVKPKVLSRVV